MTVTEPVEGNGCLTHCSIHSGLQNKGENIMREMTTKHRF